MGEEIWYFNIISVQKHSKKEVLDTLGSPELQWSKMIKIMTLKAKLCVSSSTALLDSKTKIQTEFGNKNVLGAITEWGHQLLKLFSWLP